MKGKKERKRGGGWGVDLTVFALPGVSVSSCLSIRPFFSLPFDLSTSLLMPIPFRHYLFPFLFLLLCSCYFSPSFPSPHNFYRLFTIPPLLSSPLSPPFPPSPSSTHPSFSPTPRPPPYGRTHTHSSPYLGQTRPSVGTRGCPPTSTAQVSLINNKRNAQTRL